MSVEYALLQGGEIVNVVSALSRAGAEDVAARMEGDYTVVPLDSLPLEVIRRYRYWNERP